MKRVPENDPRYLDAAAAAAKELAREQRLAQILRGIKNDRATAEALKVLERVKPICWGAEKQKILARAANRRRESIARAKRMLQGHQGKRSDLIYKTRIKKDSDDV